MDKSADIAPTTLSNAADCELDFSISDGLRPFELTSPRGVTKARLRHWRVQSRERGTRWVPEVIRDLKRRP